jgi:hypothetical protein
MNFVVVRYDSERNLEVLDKTNNKKDAHSIMEADFKEKFLDKYADSSYEELLEAVTGAGECEIEDGSAWINEVYHVDYDWKIIDTGCEVLSKPLTLRQMILATSGEDTYVEGYVSLTESEWLGNSFDDFLDTLSERLIGSPNGMDIKYVPIEVSDGNLIFHVRLDASDLFDSADFSSLEKELKEAAIERGNAAIEDVLGYQFSADTLEDLDTAFEEEFEQMPVEDFLKLYRKYLS